MTWGSSEFARILTRKGTTLISKSNIVTELKLSSADDGTRTTASARPIVLAGVRDMIKKLFILVALLAPGFAYAGDPSVDLPVEVVPAGSSGGGTAGCLSGSICPPGYTWINDFNETFSGTSLDSNWQRGVTGGGGISDLYCGTNLVVNNGLSLTNNAPSGAVCAISTTISFSTPGYFEIYWNPGDTGGAWWIWGGNVASCAGDIAQNGVEIDPAETFAGNIPTLYVHWDGYSSCAQVTNILNDGQLNTANNWHEMGIDYENGYFTVYLDGSAVGGPYYPSGGTEPGTCPAPNNPITSPASPCSNGNWNFVFNLGSPQSSGELLGYGFSVAWVRHYYHN
jgi:hypothetical protein